MSKTEHSLRDSSTFVTSEELSLLIRKKTDKHIEQTESDPDEFSAFKFCKAKHIFSIKNLLSEKKEMDDGNNSFRKICLYSYGNGAKTRLKHFSRGYHDDGTNVDKIECLVATKGEGWRRFLVQ